MFDAAFMQAAKSTVWTMGHAMTEHVAHTRHGMLAHLEAAAFPTACTFRNPRSP